MTAYAEAIVAGEFPAGKWHRLACQRHLDDQVRAARGEGRWKWRPELALKIIRFFGLLKHFKGEWGGQPIALERWQQFIIGILFGWVDGSTGLRRFRNAFIELPRGNGKSTMVGGLAVFMTFFDGEPGAEGYTFATKKDQAKIVFTAARQMVLRSRVIREFVQVLRHNLHAPDTESKLEALGANEDTLDGLRPHIAIGDEIHKHANPDLVDVIESGMGTRRQPLLVEITTAGEQMESVYGYHRNISEQVLDGVIELDEWFAFVAAADPEDDWTAEATWRKANPNYGVSVKPDFVAKEAKKALANPNEQPKFRRLYLGQRVDAVDSYLPIGAWDACRDTVSDEELRAAPCYIGVDLSSRIDLTAAVNLWVLPDQRIVIRPKLWLPSEHLEDRRRRDRVPYPQWRDQGLLETTEGSVVDQQVIRRHLVAQREAWDVREIGYDPWNAHELMQQLKDQDELTVTEVRQGFQSMSAATKRFLELVLQGRLAHGGHAVLRWMAANMKVRTDPNENAMPCKKKSRQRIDGIVAAIIALALALRAAPKKGSVYQTRGVHVV